MATDDVEQASPPQQLITIENYGPRTLRVGETFNRQSDGKSYMWIQLSQAAPAGSHIVLDGQQLETAAASGGVNGALPDSVSSTPGVKTVMVVDKFGNALTPPATIEVTR